MLENKENLPSIDFRMVTCRLLVELQQFKDAVRVLDTVVQDNDENPEAWYNLAFAYFNLKKYQNAEECCKNVRTMALKLKLQDVELQAGTEELWGAIRKALGKNPQRHESDDENMGEGNEDDEYATVSEEDISDDDAQMKD